MTGSIFRFLIPVLGLGVATAAVSARVPADLWRAAATSAPAQGVSSPSPAAAGDSAPTTGLTLTPCQIEHPSHITVVSAECGTLAVPENPGAPQGRRISLYIARVPAINRRKAADALFVLAGGPGQAATQFYAGVAPAFARIHRNRDIVLLDQRGTGRSNALSCALDDDVVLHASAKQVTEETQRCLESLSTHADVAFYTTSVAVQDLDRVRAALGYERIDLYGSSYGTRVAQHYMRRYPNRVRSAILDGVVPVQAALGPQIAMDAESALTTILARCARESACREHFGDPAATYHALRDSLAARPALVDVPDPTTGEPTHLEFGPLHLATVLRLATYTSDEAALLPLALHVALHGGNFAPLAGQFLLMNRTYGDQLAYGMHNSVVCTEDVPFYPREGIDRAKLARTFLGTTQLDALQRLCAPWPRGPIDADFHTPLRSSVPTLLLSGGNDPVTPEAYGEQAKRGLTDSLHVVLRDLGHGQLVAPCVDRLMAQFIVRGKAAGLDVSCTRQARPMPFFTSLSGPSP